MKLLSKSAATSMDATTNHEESEVLTPSENNIRVGREKYDFAIHWERIPNVFLSASVPVSGTRDVLGTMYCQIPLVIGQRQRVGNQILSCLKQGDFYS